MPPAVTPAASVNPPPKQSGSTQGGSADSSADGHIPVSELAHSESLQVNDTKNGDATGTSVPQADSQQQTGSGVSPFVLVGAATLLVLVGGGVWALIVRSRHRP